MGNFLLSNHWEASYPLRSFRLTEKLSSHWEASFSLIKFLFTGKLPSHWEASYSLDSFLLTGKLPGNWKAIFALGSILLIGNFHPTEKIPSHREVSLSLGSRKPLHWDASSTWEAFYYDKTPNYSHFQLKASFPLPLTRKYTLSTSTGSCVWLFGFSTTKIF